MLPVEVHRAKLDRTVRSYWLTFWWIASILVLGAIVDVLGVA